MRCQCSIATNASVGAGIVIALTQMAATLLFFPSRATWPFGFWAAIGLLFLPFFTCLLIVGVGHRRRYIFDPANPHVILEHCCLLVWTVKRVPIPWTEICEVKRHVEDLHGDGPSYVTQLCFQSGEAERIKDCWYDDEDWFANLATLIETQLHAI